MLTFSTFLSPSFPTHGNDRIRWERQQFPSTFCVAIKAAKHVVLVCASIIMHNWAMSRLVSSVLVTAVLCVCFVFCTQMAVSLILPLSGKKDAADVVNKVHFVFRFTGDSVCLLWCNLSRCRCFVSSSLHSLKLLSIVVPFDVSLPFVPTIRNSHWHTMAGRWQQGRHSSVVHKRAVERHRVH